MALGCGTADPVTGPELWWLARVAHWAAAVPGASLPVPSGVPGVLATATAGVATVVLWRWRRFRVVALVVALTLALTALAWTVSGYVRAA